MITYFRSTEKIPVSSTSDLISQLIKTWLKRQNSDIEYNGDLHDDVKIARKQSGMPRLEDSLVRADFFRGD